MGVLRHFDEPERLRPLGISVDATGTKYAGKSDHPISYRREASYSLDWLALKPENRARELEMIGVEILTDGVRRDPNVRYVEAVGDAVLDNVNRRAQEGHCEHAPTPEEIDTLRDVIGAAIDEAAEVVAMRWLRERGSIPMSMGDRP